MTRDVARCCLLFGEVRAMLKGVLMPVDVVNSVVIRRPLADAAQYAADPDNARHWHENVKSVEWKTLPPVQVGSQIDFGAHFLGQRLVYTYEVVEFVPGRRLTMRTPGAPFSMETTYTWENENGHADDASQPRYSERILRVARTGHVADVGRATGRTRVAQTAP